MSGAEYRPAGMGSYLPARIFRMSAPSFCASNGKRPMQHSYCAGGGGMWRGVRPGRKLEDGLMALACSEPSHLTLSGVAFAKP
eukprot:340978-Chlamydomonas_euryale.AAC.1